MKFCPTCRNKYNDELKFCVVDGIELKISDPEGTTLQIEEPSQPKLFLEEKTIQLEVGSYVEIQIGAFTGKFTLEDILETEMPVARNAGTLEAKKTVAQIEVNGIWDLEHGWAVKSNNLNKYLLPVGYRGSQTGTSLTWFLLLEDAAFLFRMFVVHINPHKREVELNYARLYYSNKE